MESEKAPHLESPIHLKPKNVYIVGAHCTGKTTLLEALKKHFTPALAAEIFGPDTGVPNFLDEVVRMIMELKSFNADDARDPVRGWQLQLHTLSAQYRLESTFNELWMFSDRSGIDPIVYACFFLGRDTSDRLTELAEWDFLRKRMKDGLVVLCEPTNASWLSTDPARVTLHDTEEWKNIGVAFREWLDDEGISYVAIPADLENLEDRVKFVMGLVESGI